MGERQTVYVVDDDESVRDSLAILLESKGYRVETFPSAYEYLAKSPPPQHACMLLDIHMPQMDGVELMGKLRDQKSPLPIIAMTGLRDAQLRERARAAGAVALFDKPLSTPQLLETVSAALRLPR